MNVSIDTCAPYSLALRKPDGRNLTLYSRRPIGTISAANTLAGTGARTAPHLRWHPLRAEWVAYAAYRQSRTFLPSADANPLRPSADPDRPTELPPGDYDVAVFDNLFPVLEPAGDGPEDFDPPPALHPAAALHVPVVPARGACEVVVFTQDPDSSLGRLPLDHLELLLHVWADRTHAQRSRGYIRYVLPFENRGVEMGVTLSHPHGQIYSYPFVPPVPQLMQRQATAHYARTGRTLLADVIDMEITSGERLIYRGEYAVAFVPVFARYPYEVWVAPRRAVPYFSDLSSDVRRDLARALKTVLLKYDALWSRPFPYLMTWYQAPLASDAVQGAHLHAQFHPPYRTRDKLKFLAGTELGAGMFANDALPEDKARELQDVPVDLDD